MTPTIHRIRFQRSALTLAALVLAQSLANAAVSEDDLKKVKVYGNVTVAQDSVAKWGPWEEFEAPAAGPAQLAGIPATVREVYRPLPDVPVEGLCAGGSLCGFGAFTTETWVYGREQEFELGESPDIHPVVLQGRIVTQDHPTRPDVSEPLRVAPGEGAYASLPYQVAYAGTPLSTGTLVFPDSGTLTLDYADIDDGSDIEVGYYRSGWVSDTQYEYHELNAETVPVLGDPADTQIALFEHNGYITDYVAGQQSKYGVSERNQELWGVIGYTTTDAEMSALRASGATATYQGYGWTNYSGTPVTINVNFGNSTWTGNWGGQEGGRDSGYVRTYTTNTGNTVLYGSVGFEAQGVITGVNLTSTSVSAADAASISGSVRGAFFGTNAAAVGGVVDITKTRVAPAAPTATMLIEGPKTLSSYSGRYVAPFAASKTFQGGYDR